MAKTAPNVDLKPTKGFLYQMERIGNRLPNPFFLFVILALVVIAISAVTAGMSVVHPGTGKPVVVRSLLSADGVRWIFTNMILNFGNFRPMAYVLAMMLGLGLAEEVGLLRAMLRQMALGAPPMLVTAAVVFTGVMGNMAGSASFVVVPPLGGLIFYALGRHPLAGVAAGFAGVAGGLSANLLVVGTDVLLASISQQAAQLLDPKVLVHPAVNWYIMIASTFVLTLVGTIVTEKVVEPRLGKYDASQSDGTLGDSSELTVSEVEKKGLKSATTWIVIYLVLISLLVLPPNAPLRDPKTHAIIPSPFLDSMVPVLLGLFMAGAIPFGRVVGTIKSSEDIVKHMSNAMKQFGGYIVLCFAAAQFIEFFGWTNLALVLAVNGAEFLKSSGFVGIPLVVTFVIVSFFSDFFVGSASAKWALMAPVFVPMFMQLNMSPAFTQAAYRIGDSVTNMISPLEPFMGFIIACSQRYVKGSGFGTVIAMMVPFAWAFLIAWTALLVGWVVLGLPLGPGALPYM